MCATATKATEVVYFIPGQGSDERLFQNLSLEGFQCKYLNYLTPKKNETLSDYAQRMSQQIDTSKPYSIVGVSLGGMLAVEMEKILNPQHVILISSAKTKNEIPKTYRFFKYLPLQKIINGKLLIYSTYYFQPFVEPLDSVNQMVWRSMILDKDPVFMKRATDCIVGWNNENVSDKITHIHGSNDRTLPIKNVDADYIIHGGTHVMTMNKADVLSNIIVKVLT